MHGRSKNLNYLVRLVKRPAYRGTFVFFYHAKSNVAFTLIFTIIRNVPQSQIIKKVANSSGCQVVHPCKLEQWPEFPKVTGSLCPIYFCLG